MCTQVHNIMDKEKIFIYAAISDYREKWLIKKIKKQADEITLILINILILWQVFIN
ncbi:MAG: hypothetical protein ACEY3J_03440 [Arsenophonus sp.]